MTYVVKQLGPCFILAPKLSGAKMKFRDQDNGAIVYLLLCTFVFYSLDD